MLEEAEQVRMLFERYLALGSVHALKAELDAAGVVTAVKTARNGSQRGGVPYGRGALFHLLRNRVYVGEIVHRDRSYPAAHPPIIDPVLFDEVQARLDSQATERRARVARPEGAPLLGKIFDAEGVPMTSAIAYGKAGRKYRYYVSRPLQTGGKAALGRDVLRRVSAGPIEALVKDRLVTLGMVALGSGWADVRQTVDKVGIGFADVAIHIRPGGRDDAEIARMRERLSAGETLNLQSGKNPLLKLVVPGRAVFRGGRTWLASENGAPVVNHAAPDLAMVRALRRAHDILNRHDSSPVSEASQNAAAVAIAESFERRIARLAFLAPGIQSAIVQGRHPAGLTLQTLMQADIPLCWVSQRSLFGFAQAT